jgi:hypothetical protein
MSSLKALMDPRSTFSVLGASMERDNVRLTGMIFMQKSEDSSRTTKFPSDNAANTACSSVGIDTFADSAPESKQRLLCGDSILSLLQQQHHCTGQIDQRLVPGERNRAIDEKHAMKKQIGILLLSCLQTFQYVQARSLPMISCLQYFRKKRAANL